MVPALTYEGARIACSLLARHPADAARGGLARVFARFARASNSVVAGGRTILVEAFKGAGPQRASR